MKTIEDLDLGTILIKPNARAKSVIARRKDGQIVLTVPSYLSLKQIEQALIALKPKLLQLPPPIIFQFVEGEQEFSTLTFTITIKQSKLSNLYYILKDQILNISIPQDMDLGSVEIQNKIQNIVEIHLKSEAKRVFPMMIEKLANKHGFQFQTISIQKSRTRWGSCSSSQKINLSYWCMLLPQDLIEFVMLHELCHTIEMNHGPHFWNLLDKVSGGNAKSMTERLKQTKLPF